MTEIEKLEGQIETVDRKVSSILTILRGNDMDKHDNGMIGMQNDHENRIAALERLKDRAIWFFVGLSFPAVYGIAEIIGKLTAK